MVAPTFESARNDYWAAVELGGALPELPEEPFDAFVELLHLTSEAKDAFRLVEGGDDPYPGMAVGDTSRPWQRSWALHLAELEPFELPGESEILFLVDSVPDAKGAHRVYSFADGVRGPVEFASLAHALAWMAVRLKKARGAATEADLTKATDAYATSLDDPHEENTTSGYFVFESLLDAPLPDAWAAYANGEWVVPSSRVETFRFVKNAGWERRLSLYLVQRFLERRLVDLPKSIKPTDLGAAHRALLKHLQAFEEAIHTGLVPEVIDDAAGGNVPHVAKLATAWTERYEKSRTDLDDTDFDDVAAEVAAQATRAPADDEPAPKKKAAKKAAKSDEAGEKPAKKTAKKAVKAEAKSASEEPVKAVTKAATKATSAPAKKVAKAAVDDDLGIDDEGDDFDALDDEGDDDLDLPLSRPKPAPAPDTSDTPFLRKLRQALTEIVGLMQQEELLELDDGKRPALISELVAAAAEARSPQHLLRQVANTLVHSENIDEVYASDEEIEDYLKRKFA